MKEFLKSGLEEGIEYKDIKKINITYTPSYGYNLTYYYINRETGHSKWVENPEQYINYITNNGGYNGPEMYRSFSEIVGFGIIILLIIPWVLEVFYILKNLRYKIQKIT